MKLEATFTLERETKNTYRYQEEPSGSGKPPIIGTLYIQKWALGSLRRGGLTGGGVGGIMRLKVGDGRLFNKAVSYTY
jgi:hypothetical protein